MKEASGNEDVLKVASLEPNLEGLGREAKTWIVSPG